MEDAVYYFTFAITFILCVIGIVKIGLFDKHKAISPNGVKLRIFFLLNLIGILSGTVLFHSVVWVFGFMDILLEFGHGEIFVAVILFNILIAFSLSLIGVILLPWKSLQW